MRDGRGAQDRDQIVEGIATVQHDGLAEGSRVFA
jgi:hypothetical protein